MLDVMKKDVAIVVLSEYPGEFHDGRCMKKNSSPSRSCLPLRPIRYRVCQSVFVMSLSGNGS